MSNMGGVSSMIRCALFLEVQLDIEILSIGRGGLERIDCALEAAGRHLAYKVILDGGFIFLNAQLLDAPSNAFEQLLSIGDLGTAGRRFVN
jgi:hypothetical protein